MVMIQSDRALSSLAVLCLLLSSACGNLPKSARPTSPPQTEANNSASGQSGVTDDRKQADRQDLNRIAELYLAGNLDQALLEVKRYLERHPKDDLAWTIQGNILADQDLDADAEFAYREALSLNEENFQAINALGVLYRRQGDYDTAMDYYQRALELEPDYAQAYSSMAVIELKRGNDAQALEYAEKGYQNDSEDPVIAANLAVAYHYNELYDQRDEMTTIAETLGYGNLDSLYQIYNGELSIRDE